MGNSLSTVASGVSLFSQQSQESTGDLTQDWMEMPRSKRVDLVRGLLSLQKLEKHIQSMDPEAPPLTDFLRVLRRYRDYKFQHPYLENEERLEAALIDVVEEMEETRGRVVTSMDADRLRKWLTWYITLDPLQPLRNLAAFSEIYQPSDVEESDEEESEEEEAEKPEIPASGDQQQQAQYDEEMAKEQIAPPCEESMQSVKAKLARNRKHVSFRYCDGADGADMPPEGAYTRLPAFLTKRRLEIGVPSQRGDEGTSGQRYSPGSSKGNSAVWKQTPVQNMGAGNDSTAEGGARRRKALNNDSAAIKSNEHEPEEIEIHEISVNVEEDDEEEEEEVVKEQEVDVTRRRPAFADLKYIRSKIQNFLRASDETKEKISDGVVANMAADTYLGSSGDHEQVETKFSEDAPTDVSLHDAANATMTLPDKVVGKASSPVHHNSTAVVETMATMSGLQQRGFDGNGEGTVLTRNPIV